MSSVKVREAVVQRWEQAGISVPLYATVDDRVTATLPPLWATPIYELQDRGPVSMGSRPYYEESGNVTLVVFGRSGAQGVAARQTVEAIIPFFRNYNPTQELAFTSVMGPLEPDPVAEGEFFPVQVVIGYTLQERP